MTNINQTVWKLLSQDVSITTSLRRELINTRALAVYLIRKHRLDASVDAVISAIRRYPLEKEITEMEEKLAEIFNGATIFTKSNMTCITMDADEIRGLIQNFSEEGVRKNFRLVRGKKYTKVIIHTADLDAFLRYFKRDKIIKIEKDLGEVRVVLQKGVENVRGVIAKITGEIAMREISITEMILCFPEILVYVNQKDLLQTHQAVLSLQEEK